MIRTASGPFVRGFLHGTPAIPRRADGPASFRVVFGLRGLRGSAMNPAAVNALAQAIQTQEGYSPGTLAYQNNNPGNLVYVGQPGATQGAGGFASFSSYSAGYQALENQITLDAVRGTDAAGHPVVTVGDLIASWAPSSDPRNNTPAYIASVTAQTGYSASDPLLSLGVGSSAAPDSSGSDTPFSFPDLSAGDSGDSGDSADSGSVPSWALAAAAGIAAIIVFRAL